MSIKVMIVDDQKISRQLFESFVENDEDFELVKSVESASLVDVYLARYRVDVILMDVVMADGSNGLDACAYVRKNYPDVKLIVVTSMPEAGFLDRAREIGVDSFWYKEVSHEPLLDIMHRTMAGEHIFPDHVPEEEFGMVMSSDLTQAELAVLRELTTGAGNGEIAERLNLSVNTVRSHIQHMLDKTGFANRTELAIEARVRGIAIK
ncbi:MAG: response regulator transcription factor [Eubacterium sp.]|nr:response regulator transcription factor [Eubacterium sp.]